MKATFLEAEVPLTKSFFLKDGEIEKVGHPRILNYTSHEKKFDTIEELHTLLVAHADMGHCFLKGNLARQLVKEPRAGTTMPNEATRLVLLDIDGIKGDYDVKSVLGKLSLGNVDYIVQYSSSMGVIPSRGISAHVFLLLDKDTAPAILKQYLIQWNLSIPLLQENLGLTATYNALRWSLDITTCQNDKLIYIAPPICGPGVEDKFEGERIQLVKRKQRAAQLPTPFPNAEANAENSQKALNELRTKMGLKERPKTSIKLSGTTEYMSKPDRAVVTGVKVSGEYTYLNLNGGDSWGYWHYTKNPEFVHNFKHEPSYKTSELLPDYWKEVRDEVNSVKVGADGKAYLAFRDFRTAGYYNGIWDEKRQKLVLHEAKGKEQLGDFLTQYGQPMGDFVPDWNVGFNPHSDVIVDVDAKTVNTYQPSAYMRLRPRKVAALPPTIRKIMLHALGGDESVLEHFLNWLAVIIQYKCMTGTAWVLHGVSGTGKGLLLKHILRPLFGIELVITKRIREIDSQFNGYMEKAFILWVDEAEQNDFNKKGAMNADIKNFITESRISIRKMHQLPYESENYLNWILSSNKDHIIQIDPQDRRFNVAVYQSEKLFVSDAELKKVEDELADLYHYLHTRTADKTIARTPLNNPARHKMIHLNRAAIDVAADAILNGNLEFFREQMPQVDIDTLPPQFQNPARQYVKLMDDIVRDEPSCILREELMLLLEYTIGGLPATSSKFSSMVKHHKLDIVPVSRKGKTYRGIPVKWKVNPEWKEKK